jgi:type IV secretion system protein TrbL
MVGDPINVGILDQIVQQFLQVFQQDFNAVEKLGKELFFYLAGLQLAISALWMSFKGSLLEASVKTLQIIFTLAIFYTLISFGGTWMPQIINGFISIGSSASGITSLSPSSVADQGLSIAFAILDNFSDLGWVTHPLGALLSAGLVIGIVIVYAFLAAELAVVLIKSYVLVTLSGLMFAFGAHESVREIALNYFKAVIGIGLQLLTLYLIMGVGVTLGQGWASSIAQAAQLHLIKPFILVALAVIIFYLIAKNVPSFIAGLSGVSGFRNYGDEAAGIAMMAGGMGATAIQNAASMGGKGIQAMGQIGRGVTQAGNTMSNAMGGGAGAHSALGRAARNVASSLYGSVKDSVMKDNPDASFGQKFNAHMAQKNAQQAAQASKTAAPGSSFKSNKVSS